jgi:hypothetical protein
VFDDGESLFDLLHPAATNATATTGMRNANFFISILMNDYFIHNKNQHVTIHAKNLTQGCE